MNKELKEMTNIGVPVYDPITMPLEEITLKCSDNKAHTINVERDIRQEAYKRITKAVGGRSNNSKEYLRFINFFANNKSSSVFDLDEIQRVINVYEELVPLERKPISDLNKTILNRYKELLQRVKNINDHLYTTKMFQDMKNDVDYYGKLNKDFDKVLALDFQDLFDAYTDTLNPEKTSLYIAYQYLKQLQEGITKKDFKKANEALFYLIAYLDLKIGKNISIKIDKITVNNELIKAQLHSIFDHYSDELKLLRYNRSFFEGKPLEDNKAVIDTLLNMDSLKIDESFIKSGRQYVRTSSSGLYLKRAKATDEEKAKIAEELAQKEYAYLKHHPIAQIECPKVFSHYKAFVYENGMVPADRFYGINHLSQLKQDAVYVFDADNFEDKIRYTKQELAGVVPRIYHIQTWQDQVAEIVTKETSEELKESAQKLVRKIEKK